MFENFAKVLGLAKTYLPSAYGGFKKRKLFEDVETFCMFIGYPRSGHSLIGALLDAHPNVIIAPELGVLKYIYAGFSKKQIYYLLLKRSQSFAENDGKLYSKWFKYSYIVPNQFQGRHKKLQVIGDKHGEGETLRLQTRPWLLKRLRKSIDINTKFIHVMRNPYDNISTIYRKAKVHNITPDLKESVEYYFSLCQTVMNIKRQIKSADIFELRHESFINNPKEHIKELCHFLGVEATDDYLSDCASIVYKSPHKSRYDIAWDIELINTVKERMEKFPFLNGYSYDE